MYQRRPRKFSKYRSNGRNFQQRSNSNGHSRQRIQSYSGEPPRNNFRPVHNPEKLLDKYNALAKEALSAGDKTLSENYLQHADHFVRLISERNKNYKSIKDQNKNEVTSSESPSLEKKIVEDFNNSSEKNIKK